MAKLISSFVLLIASFFVISCSSLPEGASAPKLRVESLSLSHQGGEPQFIINYTLEHASQSALSVQALEADIFLNNVKVATLYQDKIKDQIVAPHEKQQFELLVPVNLVGAASIDSLSNNSLLVLQGSCALSVHFTDDEDLKSFNPSYSYSGLVRVVR